MHRRDLASPAIVNALPGHCMRADAPADLRTLARVLQRHVKPSAVISHETAAELIGLPLPVELMRAGGALIHCTLAGEASAKAGGRVVVHVRAALPSFRHRGITLAQPLVVVQQIAGKVSHVDLVACVDALVGGKCDVAPVRLADARKAAERLKGQGAAAVRRAAADARERVWSPMETRTRLLLLGHGYPEPATNREIRDPVTGQRYYIDLAYPQWRIAIEYDSDDHRVDKKRWQKDLHKNQVLHQAGWTVLRISIADYRNPRHFLRRLDAALTQAQGPGCV